MIEAIKKVKDSIILSFLRLNFVKFSELWIMIIKDEHLKFMSKDYFVIIIKDSGP